MKSLILVLTVMAACCAALVHASAVAPLVAAPAVAPAPVLAAPAPVLAAPTAVSYQYSHKIHHPVYAAYPYAAPLPYIAG